MSLLDNNGTTPRGLRFKPRGDSVRIRERAPDRGLDFQHVNPLEQLVICDPYHRLDPGGPMPMPDGAEMRDAAMECKHGRLPHDRIEQTEPCGCWLPVGEVVRAEVTVPMAPPRKHRQPVRPKENEETLALRLMARRVWKAGEAVKASLAQPLALPAPTKGEVMAVTTDGQPPPTAAEFGLRERMATALKLAELSADAGFTRSDAEHALSINDTQAQYLLRKMADEGQLDMRGETVDRRYYRVGSAPAIEERPAPAPKRKRTGQPQANRAEIARRRQAVLDRLAQGGTNVKTLAEHLGINADTTSYLLRNMAGEGLVTRVGNRRGYFVLAESGQAPEPPPLTAPRQRPERPERKRSKYDPALEALREEAQSVQAEMERLAERQRMLREAITTLEQLDGLE